jgi:hypothetical protein
MLLRKTVRSQQQLRVGQQLSRKRVLLLGQQREAAQAHTAAIAAAAVAAMHRMMTMMKAHRRSLSPFSEGFVRC